MTGCEEIVWIREVRFSAVPDLMADSKRNVFSKTRQGFEFFVYPSYECRARRRKSLFPGVLIIILDANSKGCKGIPLNV